MAGHSKRYVWYDASDESCLVGCRLCDVGLGVWRSKEEARVVYKQHANGRLHQDLWRGLPYTTDGERQKGNKHGRNQYSDE